MFPLDNLSSSVLWSCESPSMITLSFTCLCFVALYSSDKAACFCAYFEDSDVQIRCFTLVFLFTVGFGVLLHDHILIFHCHIQTRLESCGM